MAFKWNDNKGCWRIAKTEKFPGYIQLQQVDINIILTCVKQDPSVQEFKVNSTYEVNYLSTEDLFKSNNLKSHSTEDMERSTLGTVVPTLVEWLEPMWDTGRDKVTSGNQGALKSTLLNYERTEENGMYEVSSPRYDASPGLQSRKNIKEPIRTSIP